MKRVCNSFIYLIISSCISINYGRDLKPVLIPERLNKLHENKEYLSLNITLSKTNRTTYSANITFDVYKTIPNDSMVDCHVYKFADNMYKPTGIVYKRNYCNFMETDYRLIINMAAVPGIKNFINTCPVVKRLYQLTNVPSETIVLPKFFPKWRFKIIYGLYRKSEYLWKAEAFFNVLEV